MNLPVTGGGSIPINAGFSQNLAAAALTSGSANLGNTTRPGRMTALVDPNSKRPARLGDWYEVADGQCRGLAHFNSVSVLWDTVRREITLDSDEVKYDLVHPRDNLLVLGNVVELTNVRVKLTRHTAESLFDIGVVDIDELSAILDGTATPPPNPYSWADAAGVIGTALIVLSVAALAIYFIPRTGGV